MEKIVTNKKFFTKGQSDVAVKDVKQYLRLWGDFTLEDTTRLFTDELVTAVKKVQKRFGFKENGVLEESLIKELNIPLEDRINQLLVNMERLRIMPPPPEGI